MNKKNQQRRIRRAFKLKFTNRNKLTTNCRTYMEKQKKNMKKRKTQKFKN